MARGNGRVLVEMYTQHVMIESKAALAGGRGRDDDEMVPGVVSGQPTFMLWWGLNMLVGVRRRAIVMQRGGL